MNITDALTVASVLQGVAIIVLSIALALHLGRDR